MLFKNFSYKKNINQTLLALCLSILITSHANGEEATVSFPNSSLRQDSEWSDRQIRLRASYSIAEQKQIRKLAKEAQAIKQKTDDLITDDMLCNHLDDLIISMDRCQLSIEHFQTTHQSDDSYLKKKANDILAEVQRDINAVKSFPAIDQLIPALYSSDTDTVVDNSVKADQIFQKMQTLVWKISGEKFSCKTDEYHRIIQKISQKWNYQNDDWHYETSTLKVSVEALSTPYHTNYYLAHVETFSVQQARSALCGGTYGNPRKTTSEELLAHNAVIGVNGSGFDYGSGIPAPGKSMIKDGVVYNDTYSNGNIMCITEDGGMFTALAGMPTDDMLSQGVRDTFCFGPTLVENGEAYEITGQFHETYRYQRAAIGMVHPGNYYIMCADGKGAGGSAGFDYKDMQDLFLDLGCTYAYNLDGGGSATMIFKGRPINTLTDGGHERAVADVLYFIDVGDGAEGDEIIIHDEEAMIDNSTQSTNSIWK